MKQTSWRNFQLSLLLTGAALGLQAQTVVFPGQTQPGIAAVSESGGVYTLSNDLFSASFIRQDNTLKFNGCEQLNLKPGSELFILRLADGSVIPASEMALASVTTETLAADPTSFTGSKKLPGQAIVAQFSGSGLNVEWRGVLRNGSHYLRTELAITPSGDQGVDLRSMVAMIYDVENVDGNTPPMVVGNTRGAMIASNNIFAGVETPMSFNTVNSPVAGMDSFTPKSWTPNSFNWSPGMDTPKGITDLKTIDNGSVASDFIRPENVVATRGYLTFREPGQQEITFQYTSGSHRLNLVGVDACDPQTGRVVASDYHAGFTGGQKRDNVYRLDLPDGGTFQVRYFVEVQSETVTSSGTISFNKKIVVPTAVFGQAPNTPNNIRRILSATDENTLDVGDTETDTWTGSSWTKTGAENVGKRIEELGVVTANVRHMDRKLNILEGGSDMTVTFQYTSGNHRLDICGIELIDTQGNIAASDYHTGYTGTYKEANVYSLTVPAAGNYTLRYYAHNPDTGMNTNGTITVDLTKEFIVYIPAPDSQEIQGYWNRTVTLTPGQIWNVSAVVGLVGDGQVRRSVGCYVDRERAVAWRPFPIYNSWFELNINRKDDPTYKTHMKEADCLDVVNQWKTNLYEQYGANIGAFVWDDGWDTWGEWDFCYDNFPEGFKNIDIAATAMNTGIGVWLGPVGGYGTSGNSRRRYWNDKGGMLLSNPAYHDCFLNACVRFMNDYDHRFFKFDGISDLFAAYGPKTGQEESAEGIIDIEKELRHIKPDIYLNTTVGTWASPFWYSISDATWRQENDFGKIGNNSIDREQWITYRDRLVYQNYVTGSPLCPINSLMTHGLILTTHDGGCRYSQKYDDVLREMRCAFACGSSMVELYCDYALMNSINNGKLWEDMAECIQWQNKNADVLADIHWVGGNPWDGAKSDVYGWASWNGKKATLALRNGANKAQTFTTTLRQALEIPSHINGSVLLKPSFNVQNDLEGLDITEPIDIDAPLTLTLPSSTVFCFDGICDDGSTGIQQTRLPQIPATDGIVYDLQGRRAGANSPRGLYIQNGRLIRK